MDEGQDLENRVAYPPSPSKNSQEYSPLPVGCRREGSKLKLYVAAVVPFWASASLLFSITEAYSTQKAIILYQ